MDSVDLNVDVLHLILDRSDRNTVSQMMKTCHLLSREGVQYLLRGGPAITNEAQAASFVQFALPIRQSADAIHRVRWLDSLHIRVLNEEEIEIVARVLKPFFILVAPRAPNFSVLEIDLAERFFRAAPELCASVASLKALKFLTLNEVGEKTVAVLRALRSRLTKAKVHFDLEIGPLAREDRDPIALLHRSQDTLRCISLMYAVSSPVAGCYRNARMLTLNDFEIPTTCHFVHAFPNLQYLRTTKCKARFSGDPGGGVRTQRDLNVAGQARDGSWGALTSYKGSLVMLYGLALGCQVEHVHIHDYGGEVLETWLILPVLGDTRPLHLTIAVRGVEDFLIQNSEFLELSRSTEFQRLQSLQFKLDFGRESWDANLEALVNTICDAIAPTPIPALTLVINVASATTCTNPSHMQRLGIRRPSLIDELAPTPSPVKLYLDSVDQYAVADRLFMGNPLRQAVKVVFIRNWTRKGLGFEQDVVCRGDRQLTVELDVDKYF